MNTAFHLVPLKRMIERAYPFFDVDLRIWGWPLGWVFNLQAYERNRHSARRSPVNLRSIDNNIPMTFLTSLDIRRGVAWRRW
jgi:hypothetical protein